jgi:hypothetical protein
VKKRTLFLVAAVVIAAHAIALSFIAGISLLPKVPYVIPPNFCLGWARFTDPATKQKMMYREFTVSTRLDKPALQPSAPTP